MKKEEVEEILIMVKSGEQEALNIKIYKNGTLCRRGCGGLPEIGISGMSFTNSSLPFDKLLNLVPGDVFDNPINYQDQKIGSSLEYLVAFYGVTKNGDTGERAEWTKSSGIRFLLDSNTSFRHPLLSFVDAFSSEAAELTNCWYFDVLVNVVYKNKSSSLPEQTIIALPNTDLQIQNDFRNYVNQIRFSSRQWNLTLFSKDKIYTSTEGVELRLDITRIGDMFNFSFIPIVE